jgi:hypothetical protein
MSPTPQQLNSVADWLERQAAETELHDIRQALEAELKQLGKEYPPLVRIVEQAKAAGRVDDAARERFWRVAREAVGDDLERKRRIGELLYILVKANQAVKAKHGNRVQRTQA